MSQKVLLVEKERFLLNDSRKYRITGVISEKTSIECFLDGETIPISVKNKTTLSLTERAIDEQFSGGVWVEVTLTLPENLGSHKHLELYAISGKDRRLWYRAKVQELLKKQGKPQFFLDEEKVLRGQNVLVISGWAVARTPVQIYLCDENKQPLDVKIKKSTRLDVVELYSECQVEKDCGFSMHVEYPSGKKLYLVIKDQEGCKSVYKIGTSQGEIFMGKASTYGKKAAAYYRTHGIPHWRKILYKRSMKFSREKVSMVPGLRKTK